MKKFLLSFLTCLLFVSMAAMANEDEENEQQRIKIITELCKIEAEESDIPPEEIEQYIQHCISQQNPWDEDDIPDDNDDDDIPDDSDDSDDSLF